MWDKGLILEGGQTDLAYRVRNKDRGSASENENLGGGVR
jgi:hypothetical protein